MSTAFEEATTLERAVAELFNFVKNEKFLDGEIIDND